MSEEAYLRLYAITGVLAIVMLGAIGLWFLFINILKIVIDIRKEGK